jgi:hypothetical protein
MHPERITFVFIHLPNAHKDEKKKKKKMKKNDLQNLK